jgi:hypothetical protein
MIANTPFEFADFDHVWSKVRARAERLVPSSDVEYAREQEQLGHAVCMMCDEGFAVLSLSPGDGGTITAFVILVVSTGRPGAFQRNEGAMLKIAQDIGAQRIAFRTHRARAWERLLGPQWRRADDRFEREVPA